MVATMKNTDNGYHMKSPNRHFSLPEKVNGTQQKGTGKSTKNTFVCTSVCQKHG